MMGFQGIERVPNSPFLTSLRPGLVVDSGDTVTRSLPVYDGFLLTNAVQQLDVGGRDITTYMLQSLREQNEHHFFSQRRGFKIADTRMLKRMLVRENAREVSAPGDFQGCFSLLKNSSFSMWKLHEDHMHHEKVSKDRTIDLTFYYLLDSTFVFDIFYNMQSVQFGFPGFPRKASKKRSVL